MSIKLTPSKQQTTAKRVMLFAVVFMAIGATAIGAVLYHEAHGGREIVAHHAQTTTHEVTFPDIDEATLSATQQQIVRLTRQEFETQPAGVKYSEGESEAWCSDFVSWIMNEAGVPLKNPNSGSWRIPGTYTLLDYYQAKGSFRSVNSGYVPQVGDVAIYRHSPIFGEHTNIVLKNDNGVLTTVGGNENNKIRVTVNTTKDYRGLLGYGVSNG